LLTGSKNFRGLGPKRKSKTLVSTYSHNFDVATLWLQHRAEFSARCCPSEDTNGLMFFIQTGLHSIPKIDALRAAGHTDCELGCAWNGITA